ncbi:MAG: PAS domain S-box protein [Janthinobacterium lividum]
MYKLTEKELAVPNRLRILIVDDDALDRNALRRALTRDALKFDTIAADLVEVETLAGAREALSREEFSCIFLDYMLPDGSGLELLIEVRDQNVHVPIIVLTGQRDEETMMALMNAGAVDYVPKSIMSPELVARSVRSAIRFQQVQREKEAVLGALRVRDNAIAAASNGIIISDASLPDYPIVYANPAFLALSGYTEPEVLGRNCRFLQGAETSPQSIRELRDAIHTQQRSQTLILNYRKDGSAFWNEVTVSPVRDPQGTVTHYIGIQTDVSDRQQSDSERKTVELQLQETVALLDTLLSSAPVGFAFFDRELRYRRVNETLAQISGVAAQDLLGRTVTEAQPQFASVVGDSLRPVLETGQAQVGVEVRSVTAPDEERFWLSSYYPVDDAEGQRLGVGAIVVEITERKAAEDALRQFQFLSDKANDAFFLIDAAGNFSYVNEAARRSLGYTEAQIQTLKVIDVDATLQEIQYQALFQQAQAETIPPFESEHRRADGTTFPIEASVTALTIGNKPLLFVSVRDITERRRQQAELTALYEQERRIAESLQRSLLNKPPASILTGLEVETVYRPAWNEALVGGDYFDVFALDGSRLALVVGDVSGKGLEAASRTAEIKYTLRAYLREHSDAASALSRLNAFLCEAQAMEGSNQEYFVVLTLAIVETDTGMAHLAAAGAEPPIVLHPDGSFEEIKVSGVPLGIAPKANYLGVDLYLETGDLLLVATDGITEARHGRQFLGNDGMARLAAKSLSLGSLAEIGQGILEGAKAFAQNRLHDDVCLLLARRR